jgi:hypothetical protein
VSYGIAKAECIAPSCNCIATEYLIEGGFYIGLYSLWDTIRIETCFDGMNIDRVIPNGKNLLRNACFS